VLGMFKKRKPIKQSDVFTNGFSADYILAQRQRELTQKQSAPKQRGLIEGFLNYKDGGKKPFVVEVEILETLGDRHHVKVKKITGITEEEQRWLSLPEWYTLDQVIILSKG